MEHECKQLKLLGHIEEFMEETKGLRPTMLMIGVAILLQVGTFLYLWGGLNTTVRLQGETLKYVCSILRVVPQASADTADKK